MNKENLWLLVLLALVVVAAGFYFFENNSLPITKSAIVNSSSTPLTQHVTKPIVARSTPKPKSTIQITSDISSSTAQVGMFNVVVNCLDFNPSNVEVVKDGLVVQTLSIYSSLTGITGCVHAVSQDINFDGYPDFMVPNDDGSGGTAFTYWLYSSSTQKFYCADSHNDCSLMNPEFYPSTKTILSIDSIGADTVDIEVYGIVNSKLSLLKHVQGSPTIIAPLESQASSTGF